MVLEWGKVCSIRDYLELRAGDRLSHRLRHGRRRERITRARDDEHGDAHLRQNVLRGMLARGLRGFIPKPYTQQKLLTQVRSTLDALNAERSGLRRVL